MRSQLYNTIILRPFTILLLKTSGKIAEDKFKFALDKIEKFSCHFDSELSLILPFSSLFFVSEFSRRILFGNPQGLIFFLFSTRWHKLGKLVKGNGEKGKEKEEKGSGKGRRKKRKRFSRNIIKQCIFPRASNQ